MATDSRQTEVLYPDGTGLARAAGLLRAGELVAFPTETVYGLGGDARNDDAIAGIFRAKGRPRFNPLIVHVADIDGAAAIARLNDDARRLAEAFWPGPLTLVLARRRDARLCHRVSAGLETVAIRVPAHPVARELLRAFGGPVGAPSANPSGKVSPTRAEHVLGELGGRISAVVDAGPSTVGIESSIVALSPEPTLLRPGGLAPDAIEACLGRALRRPAPHQAGKAAPESPGQLASHYAPRAALRLNATRARPGEALLGFGPVACALNLSRRGDLAEAAANLFHALRELDRRGVARIAVSPIPDRGLGAAINDRLRRAAAPRV